LILCEPKRFLYSNGVNRGMLPKNITRWLERVKVKRGLKEEIASFEKRKTRLGEDITKLETEKLKIKEDTEEQRLEKTYRETRYRMAERYISKGYKESPVVLTRKFPMVTFHNVEKGKEGVVLDITPDLGTIVLLAGTMHVPDVMNADYVELRLGDSDGEINNGCVVSAFLVDFSGKTPAFSSTYGKLVEKKFYRPKNTVEVVGPNRLEFTTTPELHNIKSEFCDCAIRCSIFKPNYIRH